MFHSEASAAEDWDEIAVRGRRRGLPPVRGSARNNPDSKACKSGFKVLQYLDLCSSFAFRRRRRCWCLLKLQANEM